MSARYEMQHAGREDAPGRDPVGRAPGKRTLTAALPGQRKPIAPAAGGPAAEAGVDVRAGLDSLAFALPGSGGMPAPVQHKMEAAFGADFSDVTIHESSSQASAMGALAFTEGSDVHFAPGQYAPGSSAGQELLGHELAHVVQQRDGRVAATTVIQGKGVNDDAALEHEADVQGARAAQGQPVTGAAAAGAGTPRAAIQRRAGVIQRQDAAPQPPTGPTLRSADPDVDGKTVAQVGGDLRVRLAGYRATLPGVRDGAIQTMLQEERWYAEQGTMSSILELFNAHDQTVPARWNAVLVKFNAVAAWLEEALAIGVTPATINELGQKAELAMQSFESAARMTQQFRDEFRRYLTGFSGAADDVGHRTAMVRDLAFASAVGIAVVLAAPAMLPAMVSAVEGVGLTGTAATAVGHVATATTFGLLAVGVEGEAQAAATAIAQAIEAMHRFFLEHKSWDEAVDAFDWSIVKREGWAGMKRGFTDGVLAYIGARFDGLLTPAVAGVLTRVLGPAGSAVLAMMLRRALTRAISGGVIGGALGALNAGITAAEAGATLAQILSAMEQGFVMGAAIGAGLGAAGGAYEGRGFAALRALRERDPAAYAAQYEASIQGMSPRERAAFDAELGGPAPAAPAEPTAAAPVRIEISIEEARAWAAELAASNPNKMSQAQIDGDLAEYVRRCTFVEAVFEAAQHKVVPLPGGVTIEQLSLAVRGDPVTGQRVPLTFNVRGGALTTDVGAAASLFAQFQRELREVLARLGITDAVIVQLGSGTTGWSTSPGTYVTQFGEVGPKLGKPWLPTSDTDFAIFSDQALKQAMEHGAVVNPKNTQAGRFTTIKNGEAADGGFACSPLRKELEQLSARWNELIYGNAAVDGFDFKLNLDSDRPFTNAIPVVQAMPRVEPIGAPSLLHGRADYFGVAVKNPRYILPGGVTGRHDYHLTLLSPPEVAALPPAARARLEAGVSIGGAPRAGAVVPTTIGDAPFYRLDVSWPEAQAFRAELGLAEKELHVSLSGGIRDAVQARDAAAAPPSPTEEP